MTLAMLARTVCLAIGLAPKVAAHVAAVSHERVGVEVGKEGNVLIRLMRRNGEEAHDSHSDLMDASSLNKVNQQRPVRGQVAADAEEAFDRPSKIDDSTLALWSPRMPAFIEKNPEFYGVLFACSGLAVLLLVWFHIYREDLKVEERRQRQAIANARQMVAKAAAYNQKRAEAFAPATESTTTSKDKDMVAYANITRSRPVTAALKAYITFPGKGKGKDKSPPVENMRLPKFVTARQQDLPAGVDKYSQPY